MGRLMDILMLSCKKASELVEKKLSRNLSTAEQLQLKMHTSMCQACSNYEKQQISIDASLKQATQTKPNDEECSDLQQRILQQLKEQKD